VRVAVFTDGLAHLALDDALRWLADEIPWVRDVELGVGGYSPTPHCDPKALLESPHARSSFLARLSARGHRLCALNVSGNPLHPDTGVAERHHSDLMCAVHLAHLLEVDRLVVMSGCPGPGPGAAAAPHFSGGGWLPDLEDVAEWQWSERVLPYWRERAQEASVAYPDLRLCFELHPGTCVYNAVTFERIRELGPNLAMNLDPSHFFWQGIDPLAMVDRLGDAIGFVHGKDTLEAPENRSLNGVLDSRWPGRPEQMPWNFSTVGRGRDRSWWRSFLEALRRAGYDGPVSIEYEDPFETAEASIREAAALLAEEIELVEAHVEVGT
jgi:sugar phosphate isomerase/epimerase